MSAATHSLEAVSSFLAHKKNESASDTRRLVFDNDVLMRYFYGKPYVQTVCLSTCFREGFGGKHIVHFAIFSKAAYNRRDFAEFAVFGAQNDGEY
ncbi:MAG: hypothetical protein FWF77_06945 [Defluviitaleaceae bacterium]|nr:hypothetical protein [Defluviitaleaceae bacterium]